MENTHFGTTLSTCSSYVKEADSLVTMHAIPFRVVEYILSVVRQQTIDGSKERQLFVLGFVG